MKEELQKIPFNIIHEFIGSISDGKSTADDLHVVLRHSLLDVDKITGKIFGNNETSDKLMPIFNNKSTKIKLFSKDRFKTIESDEIVINSVSHTYISQHNNENVIPKCIAQLSLLSLKISHDRKWDGIKRNITFYLAGPSGLIHNIFPFKYKKLKSPLKYEIDKNYVGLFDGLKIFIEPAHKLKNLSFKINILIFYDIKCLYIVW